jgi:hypothetical protein
MTDNETVSAFLGRVTNKPAEHWNALATSELERIAIDIDANPDKAVWYAKMLLMSVYVRNRQLAEKGDKILALADAYEALAAKIERALRIEAVDYGDVDRDVEFYMGRMEGANAMHDEFRAALTGNDEGDAWDDSEYEFEVQYAALSGDESE